jgi:hypothetical protein
MSRYRIAVLVFLVGASIANYLWMHERQRHILNDLFSHGWTDVGIKVDAADAKSQSATETAWIREVIIVTVGGVVWFLIPKGARA